jgi:hypothetical protein
MLAVPKFRPRPKPNGLEPAWLRDFSRSFPLLLRWIRSGRQYRPKSPPDFRSAANRSICSSGLSAHLTILIVEVTLATPLPRLALLGTEREDRTDGVPKVPIRTSGNREGVSATSSQHRILCSARGRALKSKIPQSSCAPPHILRAHFHRHGRHPGRRKAPPECKLGGHPSGACDEARASVFANRAPGRLYRSRTLTRWMAGSSPAMTRI